VTGYINQFDLEICAGEDGAESARVRADFGFHRCVFLSSAAFFGSSTMNHFVFSRLKSRSVIMRSVWSCGQ
jgi:uncharacterized PurR-regulated membrane protein YhhQ (DUF165 family)